MSLETTPEDANYEELKKKKKTMEDLETSVKAAGPELIYYPAAAGNRHSSRYPRCRKSYAGYGRSGRR